MSAQVYYTTNVREYTDMLRKYAEDTGKEISVAVQRELPDFSQELWKQFKAISPSPEAIEFSARARGFSMGRLSNEYTKSSQGLSVRAIAAASRIMGGDKSDLFRVLNGSLVPVRFSSRRGNKVVRGRRTGRQFSNSVLRANQLPDQTVSASLQRFGADVKRLNMRALATYYELVYRKRAAAGGWMALQWLNKVWRKGNRFSAASGYSTLLSTDKRRPDQLVNVDDFGRTVGTIDFEVGQYGVENVALTGYIPGTAAQMQRHGILGRVASVRTAKLAVAIEMSHAKAARQAGLN